MTTKQSNLQLVPQPSGSGHSLPSYIIAFVGAAVAIAQGGVWAAIAVFVIALAAAVAIEILRR